MSSVAQLVLFCSLVFVLLNPLHGVAEEPAGDDGIPLVAPKDWRGETIDLPPEFAKDMKLKGVEKIRFAPGMFKPDAADFFSYVLVFRLEAEPELTIEVVERELLTYYRGLATAVGRGEIKTDDFSISMKKVEETETEVNVANYTATLKWIEPFATSKSQTLNVELRVWKAEESKHSWIFMAVSPNKSDDPIWESMHQIRDKFVKALANQ